MYLYAGYMTQYGHLLVLDVVELTRALGLSSRYFLWR